MNIVKKVKYLLLTILYLIPVFIYANTLDSLWESNQLKVLEKKETQDNKIVLNIEDQKLQKIFSITTAKELSEQKIQRVIKLYNQFQNLGYMKIEKIKFFIKALHIETLLYPKSFSYKNINIKDYLPSHLLFIDDGRLKYNFRILANSFFIRINGYFSTEKELCDQIIYAIENPQSYIEERDPEILLRKVKLLTTQVKDLKYSLLKLQQALFTLEGAGIFSRPKKIISNEIIETILKIKLNKPSITLKELKAELQQKSYQISIKQLRLILLAYLNELY